MWALVLGAASLAVGSLVLLEHLAAARRAAALRDRLRGLLPLAALFGLGWLAAGNAW